MVLLSMTLPARVNRTVNLVVPVLYIPFSVYNVERGGVVGTTPTPSGSRSGSEARPLAYGPAHRLDKSPNARPAPSDLVGAHGA